MSDSAIPEYVFLDAQVFVQFGFQYGSTPFKILIDLIADEALKLLITNVVVREVEANIDRAVRSAYNAHKEFTQQKGRVLAGSHVPGIADKVTWFDRDEVIVDFKKRFKTFLEENHAIIIETNGVSIDALMDDYFGGKPPFGGGEPKPEFPDALSVKALAEWAALQKAEVYVVSGDKGVRAACDLIDELHPKTELQEVLNDIASNDEIRTTFIRKQIEIHEAEIRKEVIEQFEDRYFYVVEENGDAEVQVKAATLDDVEILTIVDDDMSDDTNATIELSYQLTYEAELSYDDPDMQAYDSDEGIFMSYGTREETVDRTGYARAEARVSFSGLDARGFEVNEVTVTKPKDSVGISLYDPRSDK